jgi:DNA-binding transcriptional ArsR family regulator
MQVAADQASELLKALANRHRLMIICQLIDAERSVGELAVFLGIRDSTVSQHLALLRKDGLVTARRDGQTIWYHISSGPAREVVKTLYRVYCSQAPVCRPKLPHKTTTSRKRAH